MSSRRKNTFARAVRHIKSTKVDVVEAAPVNSTSGLMTVTPNAPNPDYVPPNYPPAYKIPNFDTDTQDDGKDTTGLFAEDGTPKTSLPPVTESSPDRSYILGPMASMWYAWANATRVGYIRQSDRKMVNLGSITGKLSDWDGASGFTSYGQLTLEQTVWYKNVAKAPGQTNDPATANYRAFYPGPPSNSPDSNGRYYCTITGQPLDEYSPAEGEPKIPPVQGEMSPDDNHSAQDKNNKKGDEDDDERAELLKRAAELDRNNKKTVDILNATSGTEIAAAAAIPIGIATWKLISLVLAAGAMSNEELRNALSNWNGITRSADIDTDWPDSGLSDEEWEAQAQQGRERDAQAAKDANARSEAAAAEEKAARESGNQDRVDRAEEEVANAEKNQERVRNNNTRNNAARRKARRERYGKGQGGIQGNVTPSGSMGGGTFGGQYNSYKSQGVVLSENKKRLLREIKRPVLIEETPKTKLKGYRPNFKGKFTPQNTPDVTACKKSDELALGANARGQKWREEDKYWKGYETTERMNVIHDRMGHSSMAWDAIIDEARNKNGWKNREIQEQLNRYYALKAERELGYIQEEEDPNQDEIDKYMKDPLVKRVRKRLLTQIDYPDKPSKKGYPDEAPKPQVDGWHSDYGKKSGYYKKLDPVSALAMPTQGDPEIDAEVEKQKKKYVKPKVTEEWKSDWRDNISSD